MSNNRSVLFLTDRPDPTLARMLAGGFWHTETVLLGSGQQSSRGDRRGKIGLLCLRRAGRAQIDELQKWVGQGLDTDWIALVTPATAVDPHVRDFIARYCVNYQTEPLDKNRLLHAIGHAAGMRDLLGDAWNGRDAGEPLHGTADSAASLLIGNSAAMLHLRRDLRKIARVNAPVLITGESGTGKELAARSIHAESGRSNGPFVAVNCGALSPSLIHAELFGAEKGAFTGAHARKIGFIEAAHGGTLFLDEIGDLHPELQALLLRFIEERGIHRLGGRESIPVDVRIIAATHVDIEAAVKEQRFREDLYYRLNVLRLWMPPLRERKDDLELLANTFLTTFSAESTQRVTGFSRTALAAIAAYDWPGNVRELLNRVRRAVILASGRLVTAADLIFEDESDAEDRPPNLEIARVRAEREALLSGLKHARGNARRAAEILGISRATFYRLLEKHGLNGEALPSHS